MNNVTIRLENSTLQEIDALAAAAAEKTTLGTITRSDVVRATLAGYLQAQRVGKASTHEHGKPQARLRVRR